MSLRMKCGNLSVACPPDYAKHYWRVIPVPIPGIGKPLTKCIGSKVSRIPLFKYLDFWLPTRYSGGIKTEGGLPCVIVVVSCPFPPRSSIVDLDRTLRRLWNSLRPKLDISLSALVNPRTRGLFSLCHQGWPSLHRSRRRRPSPIMVVSSGTIERRLRAPFFFYYYSASVQNPI